MSEHQSREADWLEDISDALTAAGDGIIDALRDGEREQTAATILAALIRNAPGNLARMETLVAQIPSSEAGAFEAKCREELVKSAIGYADALRAALRGGE